MKTRILLVMIISIGFSSCIKDYIGHGSKKVVLTDENYLSASSMYQQFAVEEIKKLDELIETNGLILPNDPKYDQAQKDITQNQEQKKELQNKHDNLVDHSIVASFPRPCPNYPSGKCVPVRLDYFVFPDNAIYAHVRVESKDNNYEGVSNNLEPLGNSDLQFIRVPVEFINSELSIRILWKDNEGNEYYLEAKHKN